MTEDINVEVIKNTQKILGKYIKKPALTEKLLRKPPFRFLHDIIKGVIKETGFLKDLFSENELNSDNIKDKDAKIHFLNKIIDAVKNLTDADFNVRAGKIVAGLESENTNLLLQAIGKAIDSKVDSSQYVNKIHSTDEDAKTNENKTTAKKTPSVTKKTNKTSKSKESVSKPSKTKVIETPKSKVAAAETPKSKRSTPKESPKESNIKSKKIQNSRQEKNKIENQEKVIEQTTTGAIDEEKKEPLESCNEDHKQNENKLNQADEQISLENKELLLNNENNQESIQKGLQKEEAEIIKGDINIPKNTSARPKSARPKSGEKDKIKLEELKPLEMKVTSSVQRPKSSLRPPSVRPSSARPGAPRLRPDSALPSKEPVLMGNINVIVENVDNADEEETVIIETNPEVLDDTLDVDVTLKNKGHLVEQILEQIKEGEKINQSLEVDWEANASQSKEGMSKELSNLKTLIQNLTKAANPLGKLMNYLHEDLDAMYSELQMWTNTKKQLYAEIQKQKRLNVESNKPLLGRLEKLDQDSKKQQQEILNIQSNILRNEMRIKELVQK